MADDVLKYLTNTTDTVVTSSRLKDDTGLVLKSHKKALADPVFKRGLETLGWGLVPARGRGNQTSFERNTEKV